ncbi:MAG: hypothetical protein H8E38_03940 [SAR324 cluster bacterium]|nr:hypothetical protein [SAR324 cluster bacterium]MBL7035898.1 hypothetical protein [SAR324 cluster bacterium]
MGTETGVCLQVDPQKRIGISDVISMLKGLRSEALIEIVSSTEIEKVENVRLQSAKNNCGDKMTQETIPPKTSGQYVSGVTGNTNLPQIRELNEIAALLRSMELPQNQFGS